MPAPEEPEPPDAPPEADGAPADAPALPDAPAEPEAAGALDPDTIAEGGIPEPLGVGPEAAAAREKLAVMGPGIAVALAPTPLRLGTGVPGVTVPFNAMAACWKAENERLPEAGALIELNRGAIGEIGSGENITRV